MPHFAQHDTDTYAIRASDQQFMNSGRFNMHFDHEQRCVFVPQPLYDALVNQCRVGRFLPFRVLGASLYRGFLEKQFDWTDEEFDEAVSFAQQKHSDVFPFGDLFPTPLHTPPQFPLGAFTPPGDEPSTED